VKKTTLLFLIISLAFQFNLLRAQQADQGAYSFVNSTNAARVAALGGSLVPIDDGDIQLGLFQQKRVVNSRFLM